MLILTSKILESTGYCKPWVWIKCTLKTQDLCSHLSVHHYWELEGFLEANCVQFTQSHTLHCTLMLQYTTLSLSSPHHHCTFMLQYTTLSLSSPHHHCRATQGDCLEKLLAQPHTHTYTHAAKFTNRGLYVST